MQFLSPGKAFALLFGVILLLGGAIFLLRPDDLPRGSVTYPAGNAAPTFELTNAEAITRFKQLDALRLQMYEQRDFSLISSVIASGSPLLNVAQEELQQLVDERLIPMPSIDTQAIEVLANSRFEIRVRHTSIEDPSFLREGTGREVGRFKGEVRKVVIWTLRLDDSTWKLFDAKTVKAKLLK